MSDQFVSGALFQGSTLACVVDLTPPTFAGIASITPKNNGALQAIWALATDATAPIEYLIYIALGSVSAATLFVPGNLVTISPVSTTSKMIFTLGDQTTFIIKDQVYTLGVRAKDGVGNIDSNLAILTATALGSVDLATVFQTLQTLFATDHTNFVADHAAFLIDHLAFLSDHLNFAADHAAFVADLNGLNAILAELEAAGLLTLLAQLQDAVQALRSSLSADAKIAVDDDLVTAVVLED